MGEKMRTRLALAIGGATAALTVGAAAAETPRLHPFEELCVAYATTGQMMEGNGNQCHRHYGYEAYRQETIRFKVPGMAQTQSHTFVTIGPEIYDVDPRAGTATKTRNPLYDALVKGGGKDPEAVARAAGMVPTGGSDTLLGLSCRLYAGQLLGEMCMTDDGIVLRLTLAGMSMTATEVQRGESGDPAIYDLPGKATVIDAPPMPRGLQDLMKQYRP
jgi:hypothetical protein